MQKTRKTLWPETQEQIELIKWLHLAYPEAYLDTFASAGGLKTTATQGRIMKAMGYKPGTLDLNIAVPVGRYHGLYLDMKAPSSSRKTGTKEQQAIIERLQKRGYYACICVGVHEAIEVIDDYLRGVL